ncbi:MAG: S8 family serine peptidase [Proteobacteria bacterium]|nr:S8 family serine peptidase [Pseudomonadota bacterium]
MRRTRGCLPLAGLFAFVLLGMGSALGDPGTPYVPDQVLVKFQPGTPASEVAHAHASIHAAIRDEIPQIGVEIIGLPRGLSVGKAIGFYERNPNVEFVEPDYYVAPALVPNDPYYTYGQLRLQLMDSGPAWDITTGDPSVLVAVLDTGIRFTHPDLQHRIVPGWDFVDGDAYPNDEHGHGTQVTGVIAADTNNGEGIAGVSWHNRALCVRIGSAGGYTTSSMMAQGVTYAADQGARAINLSFATPSYLSSVGTAVDYAWSRGAVVVAAAGNSGDDVPYYPAALPHVIGVSGLDGWDELIYYSNYGTWIDVCAPAGSLTTSLLQDYASWGGTSISAPYVTGLFGLVFSVNPALTPQQAVDIVCQSATDLGEPGFDQYYGWGKINLYQAVLAASQTGGGQDTSAPQVSIASPAPESALSAVASVSVNASDDVGVALVDLYLDGDLVSSVSEPPYEWSWDTMQSADGEHVIEVAAYDEAGNVGLSDLISVTVDNTAPSAAILAPADGEVVSETTPVSAEAYDATTGVREVRFYVDDEWKASRTAAPYVWDWDTTQHSQGWHSVVAKAFDEANNVNTSDVLVEVQNTSDPSPVTETFTGGVGFKRQPTVQAHAVTIAAPGLVSASLTWGGKADLDLYLYSPTGNLVASAGKPVRGGSEEISCVVSDTGTYAFEVVAASGKANYRLTVTHP